MSKKLVQQLPKLVDHSLRTAHTMAFGKGVNYFPSLSKHGPPASISQGSQTQRNLRSSMSDPDLFMNYTSTHIAGPARHSFPDAAEGGRAVSTPDFPQPLSSMTGADAQSLRRDKWPRKNVPSPISVPHVSSAIPEPLQNSFADAEYVNVRVR